ncbi:unnamed protein product [Arabidopsis lyrata]|uniref:Predicted protein n=1 Tax=Arabidopsis lyrata subsp. lyrata TaxID=81972 RepID=D7KVM6_ARALL|nr:predicted protein [Arabidopsis lyrata subsp. lyrata]CAH8257391.1 unnamed protein product [Arabidopsis lyrata]
MALILIHQASLQIPDSHGSSPHMIISSSLSSPLEMMELIRLIILGVDLIGPAMYFGLMGDGQPIGSYDDMWAGWCIKLGSEDKLGMSLTHQQPMAKLEQ